MSNAKAEVLKMISKKRQRTTAIRNKENKKMGLYGIISDFIISMEKVTIVENVDPLTFESTLNREAMLMEKRLKSIDPNLEKVEIVWHKADLMEKMEDLKIEGVKITWSSFYLGKHPFDAKEKYIDVLTLFLANHLDEMPES